MKQIFTKEVLLGLVFGLTLTACQHGAYWPSSASDDIGVDDEGRSGLYYTAVGDDDSVRAHHGSEDHTGLAADTGQDVRRIPQVEHKRRTHIRFTDDRSERQFLDLFERRAAITNDIQMIQRFSDEQRQRMEMIDQLLANRFAINASENYHFNMEDRTIYVVNPVAAPENEAGVGVSNGAAAAAQGKVHKVFETAEEADVFHRLVRGKQLALEVQTALAVMVRQKERELLRVQNELAETYSMSRDRDYEYDKDNRELVEVIQTPSR